MKLVRFGDFAIEWSRVYAVFCTKINEANTFPLQVAIYADIPHIEVGAPAATLDIYEEANALWQAAAKDSRLTKFKHAAIDMDKVCALSRNQSRSESMITFALGNKRSATFQIEPLIADMILARTPEG